MENQNNHRGKIELSRLHGTRHTMLFLFELEDKETGVKSKESTHVVYRGRTANEEYNDVEQLNAMPTTTPGEQREWFLQMCMNVIVDFPDVVRDGQPITVSKDFLAAEFDAGFLLNVLRAINEDRQGKTSEAVFAV